MLLFGFHMHQPVDNFSEAVDEACRLCYMPFFEMVEGFDYFRFSLHCSGWLLEKIRNDYPEMYEIIQRLVLKGQVELFSGGFYEPVLPAIPSDDRVSQIKKLNSTLKRYFNFDPKGLWLAERVWDDAIIGDLKKCGIEYLALDDYHFILAGLDSSRLNGYYLTEFNGESIGVFPISRKLRYALPFFEPDKALDLIESLDVGVVFDDLEKFGLWPKTHQWVYESGWLEAFLEGIGERNIKMLHFGEFFNNNRPKGLVYLPTASYVEMGQWSLLYEESLEVEGIRRLLNENGFNPDRFIKSGLWKNFFVKYYESNRLHKRMIEASRNKKRTRSYLENLYKLQTNDVYWHGIFGGLYLPNLRDNAYRYLIGCENIRYNRDTVEVGDINLDGYEEVKVVRSDIVAVFDSRYGGQLVELDDKRSMFNFQNALTRYREVYHHTVNVQNHEGAIDTIHSRHDELNEELKGVLFYDWYIKNSFIDHISDDTFNSDTLFQCSFREYGDFANQPFECFVDGDTVVFERRGGIYDKEKYETTLKKVYYTADNGFDFEIELNSEAPRPYLYALELNLHFAQPENIKINGHDFEKRFEDKMLKAFVIEDGYTERFLRFNLDTFFGLYGVPLYTVSKSERGFDLTIQGISFAVVVGFERQLKLTGRFRVEDV
ncbi:alpha-amylase/4-alpha-glucanotransferase domain-containing protein [Hippea sp. KM1]|uniref:alpha-amylase/4-alpha-glucanotransferase domain-containing protein n=1 Tax=Hippea sp. KM1 TaxID=944481 RepID=UPI00046D17E7|nr:alpha-amylase/4-alpha-glucanotransferase domain-containing protein [Hippea sp. KM1]